jgi:hypothetical protein
MTGFSALVCFPDLEFGTLNNVVGRIEGAADLMGTIGEAFLVNFVILPRI